MYDKAISETEVQAHHAARAEAPYKLTKITLPSGRVWAENTYDPATDRLKAHTDQHGGAWQVSAPVYDTTTGLSTVTVTDPHNGTLKYSHDAWRGYRLVEEIDQSENSSLYTYDIGGFLSIISDRNGNDTELFHDERGR
ncbi:hypothetical protein AB0B89_31750 [Sphaerisporangium sp. NPDC049002]|uniref:hypothetical protein n=1 Tax=unclassified Sphaerisporangium TaxID=2630420 RepID=UPI0033F751D0